MSHDDQPLLQVMNPAETLRAMSTDDLIRMLHLTAGPVLCELAQRGSIELFVDEHALMRGDRQNALRVAVTVRPPV